MFSLKKTFLFLAGFGFLGFLIWYGGRESLEAIWKGKPVFVCLTFFSILTLNTVASLRWLKIIEALQIKGSLSFSKCFYLNISSRVTGLLLPQSVGDFGIRSYILKRSTGSSMLRALASSFLDRFSDIFVFALLLTPALLVTFQIINYEIGGILVIIIFIGFFAIPFGWKKKFLDNSVWVLKTVMVKIGKLRMLKRYDWICAEYTFEEEINSLGVQINAFFILSFVRYFIMAARSFFVAQALNICLPFGVVFFALVVVQVSLPLAHTPGGLGVLDLGWAAILKALDIGNHEILNFIVAQRTYVYMSTFILFLCAHLLYNLTKFKKAR